MKITLKMYLTLLDVHNNKNSEFSLHPIYRVALKSRGVAQPGRVRALGAWGRQFESVHPDQKYKT